MKTAKYILVLGLMIISHNLNAQSYSDKLADTDVIEFIKVNKNLLGGNRLDSEIIKWDRCDLYKDLDNCWLGNYIQNVSDTIITASVLRSIQENFQSLHQDRIERFNEFKDKSNRKNFYRISVPIITNDGTIAIIKILHYCGNDCGSGGVLIFKRIDNKWIKVAYRSSWIS